MTTVVALLEPEGVRGEEDTEELSIEVAWDSAPFNVIQTLCTWNDDLYAAGRSSERIYRSSDGEEWEPAFKVRTSYAWDASIVFNGALYVGSSEQSSGEYFVTIWRSTDGVTLEKVYESEHFSYKISCARRFGFYEDSLVLGLKQAGMMVMSQDGTNWEEFMSSDEYRTLNDVLEYDGYYYVSAGDPDAGGAVYRSADGEEWDIVQAWDDGTIDHSNGAGSMVIHDDALYLCHNGNKENAWGVVLKTTDGETFTEVWHGKEDHLNYAGLATYNDRLFLTLSGISSRNLGGEIRVLNENAIVDGEVKEDEETFVRIHDGNDYIEHHFHGRAIFDGSLFIGGGSGKGGSGDAILYRITDLDTDVPTIEIAEDELPFGTVFVLTEFDGHMYAAGRWNERIYRSANGADWELAFSQRTSYSWQNGITFDDDLYLVSCEGSGDRRTTILWRSENGISLEKIFEIENATTERPSFGTFNGSLYMGVDQYVDDARTCCLYRSTNGTNWEMIFSPEVGVGIHTFETFMDMFYFTSSSGSDGGALFRSGNGLDFELTARWPGGMEGHYNGTHGFTVFEDEIYIALNKDTANAVRILKSGDGYNFTEVWSTTAEGMNAPSLCVYNDHLFLYMCGKMGASNGTEIRMFDGTEFTLLHRGNKDTEHSLMRHLIFDDALYIGGGSGNWRSNDAIIHRIEFPLAPEPIPTIENTDDKLPFGTVFVLTEFNDALYAAGRWNEKVYRSSDGETWEVAFPQQTTYSWQNGISFEDSLYIVSCEGSGDRRTTVIWRSENGETLKNIHELENTTTERPALGIFNGSLYMGVEEYVNDTITGCLYRSDDGNEWEKIFSTTLGYRFQEFTTFNGDCYFTMSGVYCGGTLFRSIDTDGSSFELAARWNESVEYGDNGAYGLCVFRDELYVALNHDGGDKYVRLLKSEDGSSFEEIWSSSGIKMNAPRTCVFNGNLYLYICGKMGEGQGSEIWYQKEDTFILLEKGDPQRDHILLRNVEFNDALYIGGGSGNWMSHDATITRIEYEIPEIEDIPDPVNDTSPGEDNQTIPEPEEPIPTDPEEPILPDPFVMAVVGSLAALFLIGALVFFEPMLYLMMCLFMPLYTRLRPRDMEESVARAELLGYLRQHPGANYTTIKKDLEFSNGKLAHHLRMLEKGNRIRSRVNGSYKLFYPHDMVIPDDQFQYSPSFSLQREIIRILTQTPGMNQRDIVSTLGRDRKTISLHLDTLMRKQLIRMERIGRENRYWAIGEPSPGPGQFNAPPPPPPPPPPTPPSYNQYERRPITEEEVHY